MRQDHWENESDKENENIRRKTCPIFTLSTTNLTWADLGSNPSLHVKRVRQLAAYAIARPCNSFQSIRFPRDETEMDKDRFMHSISEMVSNYTTRSSMIKQYYSCTCSRFETLPAQRYTEVFVGSFNSVTHAWRYNASITSQPLPVTSVPKHHLSVILPFDSTHSTQFGVTTAPQNKPQKKKKRQATYV